MNVKMSKDFSDEDKIEEKGIDKRNQAQKYKQEKQIKPLQQNKRKQSQFNFNNNFSYI